MPQNKTTSNQFSVTPIDQIGVLERCKKFQTRSIKSESKAQALRLILNMIDLTTLEGIDNPEKVKRLCFKAMYLNDSISNLPTVAAVCVYPNMVSIAKEALKNSQVMVASVATGFPAGQIPTKQKISDCKYAIEQGADEIDMVISRGKFLSGDYNFVFDEIAQIKEACGSKTLKVILETGELGELENVRLASDIAIDAGADFIKTSTGKISTAATLPVTYVMLQAIRDHYVKTGVQIGMKPAGGISNTKTAMQYLVMVNECLGTDWLDNSLFRFGASSLANDVLKQIHKQEIGAYSNSNYISID